MDFNPAPDKQYCYSTFYLWEGQRLDASLWWDDAWPGATQDYDLFLYKWDGATSTWTLYGDSREAQTGGDSKPFERVTVADAPAGYYGWCIYRSRATRTDVDFDLWSYSVFLDYDGNQSPHWFNHERSLAQPADVDAFGAMSVAGLERGPTFAQAEYSSEGPTRDGRLGVDIAAPTNVANVSYSPDTFHGTSASAPHIAGVAAILRQAYPAYSAAMIELLIVATAQEMGVPGPDPVFGFGRALLPPLPVDTTPPQTLCRAASVKRLKTATLQHFVLDDNFSAGPGRVTIQIRNARGKVVKTLGPYANQPMCRWLAATFVCKLPKGAYTSVAKAVDKAGNAAVRPGSARLKVK